MGARLGYFDESNMTARSGPPGRGMNESTSASSIAPAGPRAMNQSFNLSRPRMSAYAVIDKREHFTLPYGAEQRDTRARKVGHENLVARGAAPRAGNRSGDAHADAVPEASTRES